ncbi:MAG: PLDc_N domain-containing protein [Deltaproteobacteria bacterium]|nr:PLDc_N domain-containing protein [Deltaproteobacteria bacterium]MBW1955229.1 PLDc_N domain-containing protein [Deltaproteobacteria bacterium]MBW2040958.1 PLDc_N domain-containing protein [Deltaproteobacteria bacterium]MBW2130946.1 PLDc_N domain-containing protein [Deltaproteobacteria bacterium]
MDWETARVWLKIGLVFFILTLLAVLDVARKDFGTIGKKAAWGVIAMLPFIGWLIYLVFGFRKGKRPSLTDPGNDSKL